MIRNIKSLSNWTMYKKIIDEAPEKTLHIKMKKRALAYFNLSSSSIISFTYEGKRYYFRECPKVCSYEKYLRESLDTFWGSLSQLNIDKDHFKQEIPINIVFSTEIISVFKNYLEGKLNDKKFSKTLKQYDAISQRKGFTIWKEQGYDGDFFNDYALTDLPNDCYDIAVYFIWYMRGRLMNYKNLNIVHGEKHSHFSAVKSIASKILAQCLDLDHMITDASICNIDFDDGSHMLGILSAAAPGERMVDCNIEINGCLQKELMNLNVLDAICFQPDHGPNNYNVFQDINGQYGLCAFDNDNTRTFFPLPSISYRFSACAPIVNEKGYINRPYMDRKLAERILEVDIDEILLKLRPYMNKLQLMALKCRIKILRKAIMKTMQQKQSFLLNDEDWNESTISEELNGKYGETYLSQVMKRKE